MKRKIIKQANQAYTITLPIEWVRRNSLDEKSEVDLEISERSLIINSNKKSTKEKFKINLGNADKKTIYRYLNALYAKGIDEIELELESELPPMCLTSTMGYAVTSKKDNIYTIKDISGTNYEDLDEIFKRVFQIILTFYDSAIQGIFEDKKISLEDLKEKDKEVNKFCIFLQRAINKKSYPDQIRGRTLFTYSFCLEKISDEIERAWRTYIKYGIKKSEILKQLTMYSKECLEKSFDFQFIFNKKEINQVYSLRDKVREKSLSLTKLDSHTQRFLRHIMRISEDAADLTHLTLINNLKETKTSS